MKGQRGVRARHPSIATGEKQLDQSDFLRTYRPNVDEVRKC
jgi:hypothetical protein